MRRVRPILAYLLSMVLVLSTLSAISIITAPSANAADLSASSCPTIQVNSITNVSYSRNSSFCVVEFKNTGTTTVTNSFTVPAGIQSAAVIVVGGGGGGGARDWTGGGGAGGVLHGSSYPLTANTTISLSVGAGGAGATTQATNGANGGDSTFGSLTAKGGGGGAGYGWGQAHTANGVSGGSGGGSAEENEVVAQGGASTQQSFANVTSYGNRGGHQPHANGSQAGGGGGGAGGAGGDVPSSSSSSLRQPGAGGAGISLGAGKTFNLAGGGGGGSNVTTAAEGGKVGTTVIGGTGGNGSVNGSPGLDHTGSGGGGGGASSNGGKGGTGIVVVAFAYSITYDANNATSGTIGATQNHGFGSTTTLRTNSGNLARTGFTFVGWNTQADGSGTRYEVGASYSTNSSLNLFAQWTSNSNNSITYDNQGATTSQSGGSTTYTFGSAIAAIPTTAPLKSGYTFAGWYTASSGGTQVTNNSFTPPSPYGSLTLYAQWTANTGNSVTYDNQGATTPQSGGSTTYTTGSAIATIPTTAPLRTGFSFSGWYTASSGGVQVTDGSYTPTTPYGTVTLYARWAGNTNNAITYNNQGATTPQSGGSSTYTSGAAITTIPTTPPQKSGFTFAGWYTSSTGGTRVTDGSYTPASPFGTVTLYAQWSCSATPDTSSSPGYTVLKFTTIGTCNWSIPAGVTRADILVVGGGGAGGTRAGGGGGAGGYLYFPNEAVIANQSINITVGAGGLGVLTNSAGNGGDSSFGSLTIAKGGGGGGGAVTAGDTARSGKAGGSGGGAAGNSAGNASASIGMGTSVQGFDGGLARTLNAWPGGGGGGSASAGTTPVSNIAVAGKGGSGTLNSITGTSVCYATGGGAGTLTGYTAGAGGDCGGAASPNGGAGTVGSVTPATPTANTGAGGGGSGWSSGVDLVGGDGASGIVIIRYVSAANTPSLSSAVSIPNGFTFNISNYDPSYTYTYSASPTATVTPGSASGTTLPVTVSGISPGQSSTITVSTSANGFTASSTVSGSAASNVATLISVQIKGASASLGTPNSVLANVTSSGSVTLTQIAVIDTSNSGSFVSAVTKTSSNSTSKIVKYPRGFTPTSASVASDTAYAGTEQIADGDYFIVRVTAQDGTSVLYYGINVTISAPVIATSSTITNAQSAPSVVVTGNDFKSGISLSDLTISAETSGLTASSVTRNSATQITVAFTGTASAGTVTVQAKTSAFTLTASSASNTVSVVVPRTISFATTSYTKAYLETQTVSASPSTGSGTITYSVGSSTACTISGSTVTISSGTGTCSVTATVASDGTYASVSTTTPVTFTVSKAVSTISISGGNYTYTGSPQGPDSVTKSGSTGSVTYAYVGRGSTSYTSSSTKPTAVGTYTVTVTLAADTNYASVSGSVDFAITSAGIVVTPTISASSMAYGTSSGLPTISYTKNPDISLTTNPTCALYLATDTSFATPLTISSTLAVGSYVVRCAGAAATNYTITYGTNPSFSVTKANQSAISSPVLSASSKSFPYSQTSLTVNSVSGGSGTGALSISAVADGTATGCSLSGSTLSATSAGTCTLTITKAADNNFEAATTTATFTFSKASQTITITSTAPSGAKVAGSKIGRAHV